MAEEDDKPAADDWRQRYQQAISEAETRETALRDEVATLRRLLLRVGTAAGAPVDALREALRGDAPIHEVERCTRELADALLNTDDGKRTVVAQSPLPSATLALLERIERSSDDRKLRSQARALLRSLDSSEPSDAWSAALALVGRAAAANDKAGLLRRLRRQPEPTAVEDRLSVEVRAPLKRLIDELVHIDEAEVAAQRLKRRLDTDLPLNELAAAVESVTELVVEASNTERTALQEFLQQLTGRLFDIHAFLADTEADVAGERQDSAALDSAIRDELAVMARSLDDARNLPDLKAAAARQLESIARHVDTYRRSQAQRQQAAEQRIVELSSRLQATEAQADRLRRQLIQQ